MNSTATIRWQPQKSQGDGEATKNKSATPNNSGLHFARGGFVLALVLCVMSEWNVRAQVSTSDQVNYVKTVWNMTSVSDDAIEAALEYNPNGSSYSGIPYKNWISFLVAAPDIYAAVENDDYRTAARLAGNFGASTAFNTALAEVGLDSVFSIASLAEFPLEFELNSFATAVKNASFQKQVEFTGIPQGTKAGPDPSVFRRNSTGCGGSALRIFSSFCLAV